MHHFQMKYKKTALTYLAILFSSTVYCTETKLPTEISRKLSEYNVTWDSPSTTGSLESMPLGNGDISANVWVEKDGDVVFYIGKTDT